MKKTASLTTLLLALVCLASACAGLALPGGDSATADPLAIYREAMAPSQRGLLDELPPLPAYQIETTVDPLNLSLTGKLELTLPAPADGVLPEEYYFRLFPNLAHYAGSMSVELVTVNDRGAPFSYEAAGTAVHVVVPADAVTPGEPVRVAMRWSLEGLPLDEERYTLFGMAGGVLSLPLFYPSLAVKDPEDPSGWRLDMGLVQGDAAFTQTAYYDVTVTVPPNYAVAATGSLVDIQDVAAPPPEDGAEAVATAPVWKAWHMVSGPAREFAIFVSDQFRQSEAYANEVRVISWFRPGNETAGRAAAEYSAAALRVYNDVFGPYPYAELDVVAGPIQFRGMEYPGLFELGFDLYNDNADELEFRAAHEVAHQWWYNLVGNDPVNAPWLDEGLAEFATYFYRQRTRGSDSAQRLAAGRWQGAWEYTRDRGLDAVVNQPVEAFGGNYETIVYGKAALFHYLVAQEMGEEAYLKLLREYIQAYRFGEATPDDFIAMAEQAGGPKIRELYQQWILSAERAPEPDPTPTPTP